MIPSRFRHISYEDMWWSARSQTHTKKNNDVTKKWAPELTYTFLNYTVNERRVMIKVKPAYEPSGPAIRLALITPVSVAWSDLEHFYFYLDMGC